MIMIVDIRLVRLRDGRWRVRSERGSETVTADRLPEALRSLGASLARTRDYRRDRWGGGAS